MKKILLISFSLALLLSGCATTKETRRVSAPNLLDVECARTCQTMAMCSSKARRPFNDHDMMMCKSQCKGTHPKLRAIVSFCAENVLKESCNSGEMQACVERKLRALRTRPQ